MYIFVSLRLGCIRDLIEVHVVSSLLQLASVSILVWNSMGSRARIAIKFDKIVDVANFFKACR